MGPGIKYIMKMAGGKTDLQAGHTMDIQIKLQPGSSKNEIMGKQDGLWRVKVTAPPVEGKANKALIALLSKRLKIPKSDIEVVSGGSSRIKRIRIHGLSEADAERIDMYLGGH